MKKYLFGICLLLSSTIVLAEDVVVRRDTVRDTIVVREVVREYVLDTGCVKKAKKKQPIEVKFEVRSDWNSEFAKNEPFNSAFNVSFVNFILNGNITDKLSYHYRQRLNRVNLTEGDGLNLLRSIDKAYFDYDFNPQWRISAGKMVLGLGGWEYDAPPIDIYFASEFWNNIACYQMGIKGMYTTRDGKSSIVAQVTNSPFNPKMLGGLYAYNLMWYGSYGCFHSAYSANMLEYERGRFLGSVSLGNMFDFGPMHVELDYMWRYAGKGNPFRDFTLTALVKGNILGWASVHAKVGYDENLIDDCHPLTAYGHQNLFYGLGVEAYPIKKQDFFRLHAYWYQNDVLNEGLKNHYLTLGVTFRLTAFKR
ncbi:MAG: OprO/OprP family phosphate-selective porin [Paludibacteraceae bacterium]|nr:OprO/OprP family phosphate-selective porin [Paludibacteraceae bacterium]